MHEGRVNLWSLPGELVIRILQYLDPLEIVKAKLVSTSKR